MIIIGIDLSGPANILDTAISVFKPEGNRLALLDSPEHGSDAAILIRVPYSLDPKPSGPRLKRIDR